MVWIGKFLTRVMQECQDVLEEVAEDFQISGTMESVMPSPPPMSHLYLKHCEGRELGVDAATPRSDEAGESDEEGFNAGESQAVLDSSQMLGASGVSQSLNGLTMTGMQSTNAFTGSVA